MHWRTLLMNRSKPGPTHWLKISVQISSRVGQQLQPIALWKSSAGGDWRTIRIYNKSKHVSSAECRRIWEALQSPQTFRVGSRNRNYLMWCSTLTRGYKMLAAVLQTITRSQLTWHHKTTNATDFNLLVVQPAYTDETLTLTNIWMTFVLTGLTYIHLKYTVQ